jgi:hypothetical protein
MFLGLKHEELVRANMRSRIELDAAIETRPSSGICSSLPQGRVQKTQVQTRLDYCGIGGCRGNCVYWIDASDERASS